MKRVDKLVVQEILGPWIFGVAIFTVLIMAGTFLFKVTEFTVKGAGSAMVLEYTMLVVPGVMAKTFPMAVLLATLLGFGRLSGESELVALRAQGISLWRIMAPVAAFGFLVSVLAFSFNEIIVPRAAIRSTELEQQIKNNIAGKQVRATSYAVSNKQGQLIAQVMAADFDFSAGTLTGATISAYDPKGEITYTVTADALQYKSEREWSIKGRAVMMNADGTSVVELKQGLWPSEVPPPDFTPDEIKAASVKDLDAYSMSRMGELIEKAQSNPKITRDQVGNLQYGYWNKIALPLAALIYALVGAPLGIRNHRTGAATGFWLAVLIIFAYLMIGNFMSQWARGQVIPAWVASFTPLVIGLVVAGVTIHRKN
ncbi:MAG: LptF/LptG family permease [Chthonomonas sp.]|nr:LptF/LptG family permease [Chthonomonas sp.]